MGINPDTNTIEMLRELYDAESKLKQLVRPDGSPVPAHWPVFRTNELVELKGYTFKVAHIGEHHLLLEPVGPLIVGEEENG